MVFGNRDSHSATGVCFSRDPATGQPGLYGEFLSEAQGEDIVAGTRTPLPVAEMRAVLPEAHAQLEAAVAALERHYRDIQDVEFTIESGRFYLLQTRGAKRTATAALRAAVDMTGEGLLTRDEAVQRIDAAQLEQLLHPTIDPRAELEVVATGLCASPGAACGLAIFDADTAAARSADGEDDHPRPARDDRGRHPRPVAGPGHPDGARRHDLSRRSRRTRASASRASPAAPHSTSTSTSAPPGSATCSSAKATR